MTADIVASVVQEISEWSYPCKFDRVCIKNGSKRLCSHSGGCGCRIWCSFTNLELDLKKSMVDSRYFKPLVQAQPKQESCVLKRGVFP